jgi:hypothetical protein
MKTSSICLTLASLLTFSACKRDEAPAKLVLKFQFDSTQQRLDNLGRPAVMPAGHAAQHPQMNKMTAHYVELAQGALTPLGSGSILYHAPEVTTGGARAIDFSQAVQVGNNEVFLEVPIRDIPVGEYEYLRVSVGYQNYTIQLHLDTVYNVPGFGNVTVRQDFPCTVASFVGYNTYLTSYRVDSQSIAVNGNRVQGYWGAESRGSIQGYPFNHLSSGQSPAGATTVVNPLAATSPIPAGSCVVTGAFNGGRKLQITGKETKDIVVRVSMSVNRSFEWEDGNSNGKWEPTKGENVVDMGLRGMIPFIED